MTSVNIHNITSVDVVETKLHNETYVTSIKILGNDYQGNEVRDEVSLFSNEGFINLQTKEVIND